MEDDCESFEHLWKLFCMKTLNGTHKYKPLSKKKKKKRSPVVLFGDKREQGNFKHI